MAQVKLPQWASAFAVVFSTSAQTRRAASYNAEMFKALAQPEVRERFVTLGLQAAGGPPEQFSNLLKNELKKWAKVVADSGIKAD